MTEEKKPIWDKEDAEIAKLGIENIWHKITDEQVRNFVRSRYYLKPGTGEFVTDYQEVRDFEATLVRNLITVDISKSICVDFYMHGFTFISFVRRRLSWRLRNWSAVVLGGSWPVGHDFQSGDERSQGDGQVKATDVSWACVWLWYVIRLKRIYNF